MRLLRGIRVLLLAGASAWVFAYGCSDDHHDDGHSHAGSGGSTHDPTSPSCAEIMDICHAADIEPGPAHECHEVAHADVEGPCAMEKARCIPICQAVLADAGGD